WRASGAASEPRIRSGSNRLTIARRAPASSRNTRRYCLGAAIASAFCKSARALVRLILSRRLLGLDSLRLVILTALLVVIGFMALPAVMPTRLGGAPVSAPT